MHVSIKITRGIRIVELCTSYVSFRGAMLQCRGLKYDPSQIYVDHGVHVCAFSLLVLLGRNIGNIDWVLLRVLFVVMLHPILRPKMQHQLEQKLITAQQHN
jgi:hypothetical protein